jgi:hypothetical protein
MRLIQAHYIKRQNKSAAVSFKILLLLGIVLFIAAGGALFFAYQYTLSEGARKERERAEEASARKTEEVQKSKIEAGERLVLARKAQEEALINGRTLTNALHNLRAKSEVLLTAYDSLQTNQIGIKVGQHPELVRQARHLRDTIIPEIPSDQAIVQKLEGARRLILQLEEASGTSYQPSQESIQLFRKDFDWAKGWQEKADSAQALYDSIVREAKVRLAPSGTSTTSLSLAEVLRQQVIEEANRKTALVVNTTDAAKASEAKNIATAAADLERQKAQAEIEKLRKEKQMLEAENEAAKNKAAAELAVLNTQKQIEVQKINNSRIKEELKAKANDPEVREILSPFITPGIWIPDLQIGAPYAQLQHYTPDSKPVSLNRLRALGVFDKSGDGGWTGIGRLAMIAVNPYDKKRPRWWSYMPGKTWRQDQEKVKKAQKAQALLMELGDTMVEMGLLSP